MVEMALPLLFGGTHLHAYTANADMLIICSCHLMIVMIPDAIVTAFVTTYWEYPCVYAGNIVTVQ